APRSRSAGRRRVVATTADEHAIEVAACVERANVRVTADGCAVDEDLRDRPAPGDVAQPAPRLRIGSIDLLVRHALVAQEPERGRAVATPRGGEDLHVSHAITVVRSGACAHLAVRPANHSQRLAPEASTLTLSKTAP